ncbi:MAG: hypothetical protein IPM82_28695 [Saprospiraceae bacterium]|nr:hypothetical protein [Saprospiraceae bacterium]
MDKSPKRHGTWAANATVDGPAENPTRKYVSFGLLNDFPVIDYVAGTETLLFTFLKTASVQIQCYIIDNNTDPFKVLPNSLNSNPGNEFSVFDPMGKALYKMAWHLLALCLGLPRLRR